MSLSYAALVKDLRMNVERPGNLGHSIFDIFQRVIAAEIHLKLDVDR